MKKGLILFISCFLFFATCIFSQNVGIGTVAPTRARLEVHGVAGSGNTSAIFGGDGNGISMQRNWPTIGFNHNSVIILLPEMAVIWLPATPQYNHLSLLQV